MWDFIVKYWVEFVFGLISSGLIFWVKHDIKMHRENIQRERDQLKSEIRDEVNAQIKETEDKLQKKDVQIQADIEALSAGMENLTAGLLSVQGKAFIKQCRKLLQPDYVITLEEFEDLEKDHNAYNGLGGNHRGDELFSMVEAKFKAQVSQ